jgi:hypothetical protein
MRMIMLDFQSGWRQVALKRCIHRIMPGLRPKDIQPGGVANPKES